MILRSTLFGVLLVSIAAPLCASSGGTFFDTAISMSANDSGGIPVGANASLRVTVKNVGTASGVDTANVDVPSNFAVLGTNCGAGVTPQGAYTLVSWSNISFTPGQTDFCDISLRLLSLPPAGTASTAFATLEGGGTQTSNNAASYTFNLLSGAVSDISIDLSSTATSGQVGVQLPVTVTVANGGPSNASSVIATITPPASLRLDKASCVSGTLANPFVWNAGSINAISNKTCALTYTVVAATPTPSVVTARVTSGSTDNTTANNSDSLSFSLGSYSGVKLDIDTSRPGPVKIGDGLIYTLTVRNGSTAVIGSGTVSDVLPAQLAYQSSSCGQSGANGFSWTLPAIQAGASASCALTVKVISLPTNFVLHNTATAAYQFAGGQSGSATAMQDIGTIRPAQPAAKTVSGAPTTKDSGHPTISADGKLVAFSSLDSGYLSNDKNSVGTDVYLLDRRSGAVKLLSVSDSTGNQLLGTSDQPALSGNGQAIAFLYNPGGTTASLGSGQSALTTATSTTICVSPPNGLFKPKCLTGTNGQPVNGPAESPTLSADGRFMAFCSSASNIPGTTDTNGKKDVFVLDQTLGQVKLVSTLANNTQSNGDSCEAMISGDGKSVVFSSTALNFGTNGTNRQVFRKDLTGGALTFISRGIDGNPANTDAGQPTISYDGKRITFASRAGNLENGVPSAARNVWVYDETGVIATPNKVAAVRGVGGALPNQDSAAPAISCNGRIVAFTTLASNLAPPDTNNKADIYVYDVDHKVTRRAVAPQAGVEPNGTTEEAVLDCEGNTMAFATGSSNLSGGDPNPNEDIYGQDSPLRTDASAVTVDASFSGNWYNPGNDGHGFLIEALSLPGTPFYVTWYVFQGGQPVFLQGVASAVGNTLTVDMTTAKSTAFPVGAGGTTSTAWGKLKLSFTDANTGQAEWTPTAAGYGAGTFNLRRLTTPALIQSDAGQTLKACYSGIWSDPAKPGYGVDLEVNDFDAATRLLTVYWYTYQPNGTPLWLVGTGAAVAGKVAVDLYQFNGGGAQFPPAYAKAGTTATKWGSVTVQFTGNDAASFAWQPATAGYSAGTGNLKRLTALANRTCQ